MNTFKLCFVFFLDTNFGISCKVLMVLWVHQWKAKEEGCQPNDLDILPFHYIQWCMNPTTRVPTYYIGSLISSTKYELINSMQTASGAICPFSYHLLYLHTSYVEKSLKTKLSTLSWNLHTNEWVRTYQILSIRQSQLNRVSVVHPF